MAKEIKNYQNLEVSTMDVYIPTSYGSIYGNCIRFQFKGLMDDIDYNHLWQESPNGLCGVWIQEFAEFQNYETFMKGIENAMTLGNNYERMKFLNILYKYHNLPEEYNKYSYAKFLAFVCELGVYNTKLSATKPFSLTFSEYFKKMVNEYNKLTGIGACSATRFVA